MGLFEDAAGLLPAELRQAAADISESDKIEELRLRCGYAPTALICGTETVFADGRAVTGRDLSRILETATGASVYSAMDSLSRGYITVRGGIRIGVCGTAVTKGHSVSALRELTSMAIRIPGEVRGCADGVYPKLGDLRDNSVLIISPPGGGKTTLLRELIRRSSDLGTRVSLADERGEVAGVWNGVPQFDVGRHTDILTGADKAEASMLLLRSMNPQLLAMDEITAQEDISACEKAANCGVSIIATVHGSGIADLRSRPLHRQLLERGIFRYAVLIKNRLGMRGYEVTEL